MHWLGLQILCTNFTSKSCCSYCKFAWINHLLGGGRKKTVHSVTIGHGLGTGYWVWCTHWIRHISLPLFLNTSLDMHIIYICARVDFFSFCILLSSLFDSLLFCWFDYCYSNEGRQTHGNSAHILCMKTCVSKIIWDSLFARQYCCLFFFSFHIELFHFCCCFVYDRYFPTYLSEQKLVWCVRAWRLCKDLRTLNII